MYAQASGSVLDVTLDGDRAAALKVSRRAVLDRGSRLVIRLDGSYRPRRGAVLPVIESRVLQGRFKSVTVDGFHAEQVFTGRGLSVRLT